MLFLRRPNRWGFEFPLLLSKIFFITVAALLADETFHAPGRAAAGVFGRAPAPTRAPTAPTHGAPSG